MKTHFHPQRLDYLGHQLSSHFLFKQFQLEGDALVAYQGRADVTLDHMVDLEDVVAKKPIFSPNMLHFQAEWFIDSLDQGILLQNLFVDMVYQTLWEVLSPRMGKELLLSKKGNDLFYQGRKLSVSIATKSSVSVLMHMGINIETEGTPIPTCGLKELGLCPELFAQDLLTRFTYGWDAWKRARYKVQAR